MNSKNIDLPLTFAVAAIVLILGAILLKDFTQQGWFSDGNHWVIIGTLTLASAAIAQFEITRKTAKRQLRAYVLVDGVTLYEGKVLTPPLPTRNNWPGFSLTFKNFGQTPAYGCVSWAELAVIPPALEYTLAVPKLQPHYAMSIGSQGTTSKNRWFTRALTASECADISSGLLAIFVYGRIEYRDVYHRQRYTNFRMRYEGVFPPIVPGTFNCCQVGNDAN